MSQLKVIVLALGICITAFYRTYSSQSTARDFHSEQEAKQYCPHEAIVWVQGYLRVDKKCVCYSACKIKPVSQ